MLQHLLCSAFGLFNWHDSYSAYIFFSNRFVFFKKKNIYVSWYIYILLYWHNKFHNIFTIIDVSIFYKSK